MKISFDSLFPLPKLLSRPAVGLDISDESIKLVELDNAGGGVRLKQFAEFVIPAGAIAAGQIKRPADLVSILSAIRKRHNIFQANVSLPEEQTYVTKVHVALAPNVDIREEIELHLDEYVPLAPQETEFDYELIESDTVPDAKQATVDCAVVAVPKDSILSHLSCFHEAGIEPMSFEIEAQAIARALIKTDDLKTTLIVDFGKSRTGLSIVSRGSVLFSATLPFGGQYDTNIVMQMEHVDESAAERLKRATGLAKSSGHEELYAMLLSHISVLRDEISKYLSFWRTHKKENDNDYPPVEKILLCGGEANLPGLPEYLSATLDINVTIGNVWINAFSLNDYIPTLDQPNSLRYATAVGLALRAHLRP